jgi:hypothetical protein
MSGVVGGSSFVSRPWRDVRLDNSGVFGLTEVYLPFFFRLAICGGVFEELALDASHDLRALGFKKRLRYRLQTAK